MARKRQLGEHQKIEYMCQRSAAILLADVRTTSVEETRTEVSPVDSNSEMSTIVPFTPVLLTLNAIRLWKDFQESVISVLPLFVRRCETRPDAVKPRFVDWGSTCESILAGKQRFVLKSKVDGKIESNLKIIEYIFLEYYVHVSALSKVLVPAQVKTEMLGQLDRQLKRIEEELSETWARVFDTSLGSLANAVEKINPLPEVFAGLLDDAGCGAGGGIRDYASNSAKILNLDRAHDALADPAIAWREDYLLLNTGLGIGSELLVNNTTDVDHLFEIWCFFEFLNEIAIQRKLDVLQQTMCSGKQNLKLFSWERDNHVFYNWRGNSDDPGPYASSKVLKRSEVEWFIVCKNGNRIVFDTKFMKQKSSSHLTVMGYMNDFCADIGIVVFGDTLDLDAYDEPTVCIPNMIAKKLDKEGSKKFIAAALIPSIEAHEMNRRVLRKIIQIAF